MVDLNLKRHPYKLPISYKKPLQDPVLYTNSKGRVPSGQTPWAQRESRRRLNKDALGRLGLTPSQFSERFHLPAKVFSKLLKGTIDYWELGELINEKGELTPEDIASLIKK
jgi:hypothetical protein